MLFNWFMKLWSRSTIKNLLTIWLCVLFDTKSVPAIEDIRALLQTVPVEVERDVVGGYAAVADRA